MMTWISNNSEVLGLAMNAVYAFVWLAYLQLFFISFRRQRRPSLLINTGAGNGLQARCFIANMGFEPIYVTELFLRVETEDERFEGQITDRYEMTADQLNDPGDATNQGPLKSGESFDAGSFGDLVDRLRQFRPVPEDGHIRSVELTVVAAIAAANWPIAARRGYDIVEVRGVDRLQPRQATAEQVRSRRERWRLKRNVDAHLERRRT